MNFGERLKLLRGEKGVSQQALARAIFVSRSAVAKWENGLGIPNSDSYRALLSYFGLTEAELPLNPETESGGVAKNRKIRRLALALVYLSFFLVATVTLWLAYALSNGFGFSSAAAAGEYWADNEFIHTEEYDFYYSTTSGIKVIDSICAVEKRFIGYRKLKTVERKTVYDESGEVFGYVYSYKGKNSYYHFFKTMLKNEAGKPGLVANLLIDVNIKEESYPVFYHSYFETPFELYEFESDGKSYSVK